MLLFGKYKSFHFCLSFIHFFFYRARELSSLSVKFSSKNLLCLSFLWLPGKINFFQFHERALISHIEHTQLALHFLIAFILSLFLPSLSVRVSFAAPLGFKSQFCCNTHSVVRSHNSNKNSKNVVMNFFSLKPGKSASKTAK